ncbi:hypothetical protein DL93DRAFT_1519693 [Clavulina sp. PMI_390]|nr:hypothetical protein DL93DRAFT_1519693 [Clavulina sp. PMI_390]
MRLIGSRSYSRASYLLCSCRPRHSNQFTFPRIPEFFPTASAAPRPFVHIGMIIATVLRARGSASAPNSKLNAHAQFTDTAPHYGNQTCLVIPSSPRGRKKEYHSTTKDGRSVQLRISFIWDSITAWPHSHFAIHVRVPCAVFEVSPALLLCQDMPQEIIRLLRSGKLKMRIHEEEKEDPRIIFLKRESGTNIR